jgi:hypothetical protein
MFPFESYDPPAVPLYWLPPVNPAAADDAVPCPVPGCPEKRPVVLNTGPSSERAADASPEDDRASIGGGGVPLFVVSISANISAYPEDEAYVLLASNLDLFFSA